MSSGKKRFISRWSIRKMFGKYVLHGWEHHAGRWITDRILWQACGHWRNEQYYQYFCENGRYLAVGRQAPPDQWKLEE